MQSMIVGEEKDFTNKKISFWSDEVNEKGSKIEQN